MSLINDALKRAAEAKKQHPADSPPPAPLLPVNEAARPNPLLRLLAVVVLLALVALSGWSFSQWWQTSRQSGLRSPTNVVMTQTGAGANSVVEPAASPPVIKVSTNIVTRNQPDADSVTAPVEMNLVESPATEPSATAIGRVASPSFPQLKLQSIIYGVSNPAVVINGDLLYVGETIKDARVVKIERSAVTVVWQGETNILRLPRL